jgi:hypothetical protein
MSIKYQLTAQVEWIDNKQCFHNQFHVHLSAARNTPQKIGHTLYPFFLLPYRRGRYSKCFWPRDSLFRTPSTFDRTVARLPTDFLSYPVTGDVFESKAEYKTRLQGFVLSQGFAVVVGKSS